MILAVFTMVFAYEILGLSLAELVLIGGVLAIALDRVIDRTGLSPTSRTLKDDNKALRHHNELLEDEVVRLKERVNQLETQVGTLKGRDVGALLDLLKTHDEFSKGLEIRVLDALEAQTKSATILAAQIESQTIELVAAIKSRS